MYTLVSGQAEENRLKLATLEGQLSREKQKLDNKLLALKAVNDATTDPTEDLERSLENVNEVRNRNGSFL